MQIFAVGDNNIVAGARFYKTLTVIVDNDIITRAALDGVETLAAGNEKPGSNITIGLDEIIALAGIDDQFFNLLLAENTLLTVDVYFKPPVFAVMDLDRVVSGSTLKRRVKITTS